MPLPELVSPYLNWYAPPKTGMPTLTWYPLTWTGIPLPGLVLLILQDMNWNDLLKKKIRPPFVPTVVS